MEKEEEGEQEEEQEKWSRWRRKGGGEAGGRGGAREGIGEDGGEGEVGGAGRLESGFLVQLKQEVVFPPGRKLLLVGRPVGTLLLNMADT